MQAVQGARTLQLALSDHPLLVELAP
jgi:hypothetical protein